MVRNLMRGFHPGLGPEIYVAYIYTAHNVIPLVCMYEMVTMLCISAEFQFDVVNIDDKSMRKLVDTDSINTACLCLCCHSIKMCRKYASG